MPHLQDYEPSVDHLVNMVNTVNYTLMQTMDDKDGNIISSMAL